MVKKKNWKIHSNKGVVDKAYDLELGPYIAYKMINLQDTVKPSRKFY